MLKDVGAAALEEAGEALRKVAEAVRTTGKEVREISLERALGKACATEKALGAATEALSLETKAPDFLIDMWCEESGRTRDQVVRALRRAAERAERTVRENRHPDNVPELLSGEREFGLVFLPRKLMLDLYELGEGALEIREGRRRADGKLESLAIRVFEGAGEWVSCCRRRWGPPPDSELVPVSSFTGENAPDGKRDPPF